MVFEYFNLKYLFLLKPTIEVQSIELDPVRKDNSPEPSTSTGVFHKRSQKPGGKIGAKLENRKDDAIASGTRTANVQKDIKVMAVIHEEHVGKQSLEADIQNNINGEAVIHEEHVGKKSLEPDTIIDLEDLSDSEHI